MLITELVINRPIRDVLDLLVTPDLAPLAVCPHDSLYDWLRLIPRRRPSSSAICIELIDCPHRFCPFLGLPEGSSRHSPCHRRSRASLVFSGPLRNFRLRYPQTGSMAFKSGELPGQGSLSTPCFAQNSWV